MINSDRAEWVLFLPYQPTKSSIGSIFFALDRKSDRMLLKHIVLNTDRIEHVDGIIVVVFKL